MPKREIGYIVVIVILLVVIAVMFLQNVVITGSQQQALDKLTAVYELISEADVEVLSVEEVSGVYKVLLRLKGTMGDTLEEVYVTKDGSLITAKIIDTEDYKTRLEDQKAFAECLKGKNLLVFGQSNEPNTIQQLQILGSFSYKIYVDCVGAQLEACQQLGIEQIPSVVYDGKIYTGVKNIDWFESLTGCEF
ncbi:MAG: hypothetical protein JSW41_02145 [Candidatus Aenigmatarchaeota archaeon]|nr:MAG: hypothetical protein JSW41_02145 [Candidatus Aenigmarchaeota archaeon]